MESSLEIQAANAGLLAPTATDLVAMVENGEADKMPERIQTLGQQDFIAVRRALQVVDKALDDYALSWRNADEKSRAAAA